MGTWIRLLIGAGLVALAATPAATAGAPAILAPPPLVVSGADYGSCAGFDVTADFVLERRITSFLEGDELVKQVRHVSWEGALHGNGRSLPYGGTVTFTFDFAAGTLTKTGRFRYTKPGQGGLVVQDTGRTVESLDTGDVLNDTAGTIAQYDAAVCALLAG